MTEHAHPQEQELKKHGDALDHAVKENGQGSVVKDKDQGNADGSKATRNKE